LPVPGFRVPEAALAAAKRGLCMGLSIAALPIAGTGGMAQPFHRLEQGIDMAETQSNDVQGSNGGVSWDKAARDNRDLYSSFLGLTKWAIIVTALVLIGLAVFLI